ncbi:DUF2971 domain-containing protein [Klebsiella variicola]|uniref:DUF2971 domain-containing protein n=1 Tax=Klebsiella variicola TaxID=244366 RepID=UPI00358FAE7B
MNLYHYTSLEGLYGILRSNSMWATHLSYLNDINEFLHGFECIREAIPILEGNGKIHQTWFSAFTDYMLKIQDISELDYYITCFCMHDDLLSQWRGYSKSKQGVCLEFDELSIQCFFASREFEKIKSDDGNYYDHARFKFSCKKVEYIGQKDGVHAATYLEKNICEQLLIIDDFKDNERARNGVIRNILNHHIPILKNIAFKEEGEYRMIAYELRDPDEVHYRHNDKYFIPYMRLRHSDETKNIPIKKITIGPSSNAELTRKSILSLLRSIGRPDIQVTLSKIPYRE